jgi:iron-sulfur cluster assembly protein
MIPVKLSSEAQKEISEIFNSKKIPDGYGLRLTVNGGGCSGVSYKLGFDQKKETDLSYYDYGFEVLIAKKDLMFLIGKKVAFKEEKDTRGFVFEDEI